MADYITKFANFNRDYVTTGFQMEGYYDHQIYPYLTRDQDKEYIEAVRRPHVLYDADKKQYIYELIFFPSNGFCLDNKPLPLNTTLKLKFNRLNSGYSTFFKTDPKTVPVNERVHHNKPLEIKDCYAICEYVSSPSMRNYFSRIRSKPISYKYQEVTVATRDIPMNQESITLHNIKGGNTPTHFFFALTDTDAFQGQFDLETCSFGFHEDLTRINLTLNGQSCSGYPQV